MKKGVLRDIPTQFLLTQFEEVKNKHVLVVDCHAAVRTYLRTQLSMLGVKLVQGAVSSADVMRLVRANQYDIILCDYMLDDGRDGLQLLEELRAKHLIALSTIFIIVTGENAYKNVVAVAELAPDEYLVKPFTAEDLNARLMAAMYKRKVFEDVYRYIGEGDPERAIAACDAVAQSEPKFYLDALRMKGEMLNAQHRHVEAEEIYRKVTERKVIPWAKMGLAFALFQQGKLTESRDLAEELIEDFPEYMVVHDFLAQVHEAAGDLDSAQAALERATAISPNNTARQRTVGDIAVRNDDLETADKAYATVVARGANSTLATVDDYANLARVRLERGDTSGAAQVAQSIRRERRGDKQAELAALVVESMAAGRQGDGAQAQALLDKALAMQSQFGEGEGQAGPLSHKLAIDLAHACIEHGRPESGESLMRQVAAENPDNRAIVHQIKRAYSTAGRDGEAEVLLQSVNQEIIDINNQGVLRARQGDLEGSVELLMQAADSVPNIQFLVNATKAIFTLCERRGWQDALAVRGVAYLKRAIEKDPGNAKVAEAKAVFRAVAGKYGITVEAWSAGRGLL